MGKTTKTMTVILGITVASGMGTTAQAQNADFKGFPDVPKNHWAYQAVTDLAQRGIVQGYPAEGGKLRTRSSAQPNINSSTKPMVKPAAKSKQTH